jgi:transcription antitermination factor NusG
MNIHAESALTEATRPWYALTVKPRHERAVAEQLRSKSLEEYLPLYRSRRRWSDRIATVELPLFPRYVFCRFTFAERLKVLQILSVRSIVSCCGKPCAIDQGEIATIQAMTSSGQPIWPWPLAKIGQRVLVCAGPLEGLEGILAREKSAYRVVVNMEILNRAVAVEVERDLIRPAGPAPVPTGILDPRFTNLLTGAGNAPMVDPATRPRP